MAKNYLFDEEDDTMLDVEENLPSLPGVVDPSFMQRDLSSEINSEADEMSEAEAEENEALMAQMSMPDMPELIQNQPPMRQSPVMDKAALDQLLSTYKERSPARDNSLALAAASQQIGQGIAGRYSGEFKPDLSVLNLIKEQRALEDKNKTDSLKNVLSLYKQMNSPEKFQQSVYLTQDDTPLTYSNKTGKYMTPEGTEYTGKVKVRASPFQEEMVNIRKNEFGQRQEEEARRQEAAERKERIDKLTAARNLLKDDPRAKKSLEQATEFESVDELIAQIEQGNQLALGALGTKLARAMGEVGVLTDTDVVRYVQGQSWGRKLKDWFIKGAEGELSKDTLGEMTKNLKTLRQKLSSNLDKVYTNAEERMSVAFPDMEKPEIRGLLGRPMLKDEKKQIKQKFYSPSTNKTKIVYSDGSEEVVDGRK